MGRTLGLTMSLEAGASPRNFASGIQKPKAATVRNQEFPLFCPQCSFFVYFFYTEKQINKLKKKKKKKKPKPGHNALQVTFVCYLQYRRRLEGGGREAVNFMCLFVVIIYVNPNVSAVMPISSSHHARCLESFEKEISHLHLKGTNMLIVSSCI